MKIEIDTVNKKIVLKESMNIMEFINELQGFNDGPLQINLDEYIIEANGFYYYYPQTTSVPYYNFNGYTPGYVNSTLTTSNNM